MTEEVFVPIEKVANHFCVTVHTIRAWTRQGFIPRNAYIKVGNTYRYSIQRVTDALTSENGGNIKDPEPETTSTVDGGEYQENEPIQLELDFDTDEDA